MARFSQSRLSRLSARLAAEVEAGRVPGLGALVARGDEVHVEVHGTLAFGGGEPMRRDTPFRIASVTKPIAAAAAMTLVEEGLINLDEPVARWLPELAEPKVLRSLDSAVDDVVPASRPITVRDLLTFRLGHGAIMAPPGRYPIQAAQAAAGVASGPEQPALPPDAYMRALGGLPLLHQPGERWLYDTGSDVLGVLMARATGRSLGELMAERVLGPLGMKDTGFHAPEPGRLPTLYGADGRVFDLPEGVFARPRPFSSASGGLVSTLDDLFAFSRMMLAGGRSGRARLLSRAAVALMTRDHITAEQKALSPFGDGFWDSNGWGFGLAVTTRRDWVGPHVGSFGWIGGYGTSWWADPAEDLTVILLTQRVMGSPDDNRLTVDFWTLAYQALDD